MSRPDLGRMTWREAQRALARAKCVLVPIGSTEQHGPHMTLDTDTEIAKAFAQLIANELGDDAVLAPTIPFGMSEHHMHFAGTLTLSEPSLSGVVRDIVTSLKAHGANNIIFVNGHGGNQDALRLAGRAAQREKTASVATLMWALLASDLIAERASSEWHAHACDIETSVALSIAPHIVHLDRIEAPVMRSAECYVAKPGERVDVPVPFHHWTENGALGDPRLATKELGDEIVALALQRAVDFCRKFMREGI